ncbi:hypothetical protein ODY41_01165 [Aerococcus urinae]|uniref:hypothetical protein n=1 Tax=Aerococcus urinae TaxID=1376 RepID=UPI000A5BC18E|nr:hypothetical protein [Aerococcus urinae]MCY3046302.1 hypothetical protein [Aerococcus urinae]MCY3059537.1 hypothetical protein [Aerococcus urinae]
MLNNDGYNLTKGISKYLGMKSINKKESIIFAEVSLIGALSNFDFKIAIIKE